MGQQSRHTWYDPMQRVEHALSPNKRCERVRQAIWFDTETHAKQIDAVTVEPVLWYGWACYSRMRDNGQWTKPEWCRFEDTGCFISFINAHCRPKSRVYMYCHNTNFDIPVLDLITQLALHGWELKSAVIEAPPTILKYKMGTRSLVILDTLNYWRMKLKTIGEMVGEPKLPMPADDAPRGEWDTYCQHDCLVIMRACQRFWSFIHDNDLGNNSMTLASQSMHSYRHRFMQHKVQITTNGTALKLARKSYTGGRVECFYIGHVSECVVALDVNSMYPFVMRDGYFPCKLRGVYKHVTVDDLNYMIKHYCVTAQCLVNTVEPVYPIVHDKRLVFPTGRFVTTLSTPEIEYGLCHSLIEGIGTTAVYARAKLFTSFVDYFYNKRLEAKAKGDMASSWMFKILLNSLYGKFGQRGHEVIESHNDDDLHAESTNDYVYEDGRVVHKVSLGGLHFSSIIGGETYDSFPAIAAHVTAYGRQYLWNLISRVGCGSTLYCDTDCLWIRADRLVSYMDLLDASALGGLKVEHEANGCIIRGPKDYTIGAVTKLKGARANAVWLTPDECRQEQWDGLKGMMREGRIARPHIHTITKHFRRRYTKGKVLKDGTVVPYAALELGLPVSFPAL